MNYRHHFHAGNFADVMKHVLLVRLIRALQKKEKGVLHLDTHAGRGSYDLTRAAVGDTLVRKPEWPDGIGRLVGRPDLPPAVAEYVAIVRECDRRLGNLEGALRFYPGSPWITQLLRRRQDRLELIEQHPGECAALRAALGVAPGVAVLEADGYRALRAKLPPPERRGLVLIDPPYEAPGEFAQVVRALGDGLQRFASGVFAIWYPLTGRARADEFLAALLALSPPPTLTTELAIAGGQSTLKLKGCGLVVINPPWQFAEDVAPVLGFLAEALAQAPGSSGRVEWLVPAR